MKKIYATLLAGFITTAAMAQPKLTNTLISPANNTAITVNTPFAFKVEFKNTGTAGIVPTDTIFFSFTGASGAYYITGKTKAVNDTILLSTNLTFSAAPNGAQDFCVLGYIFRGGMRTETGADTVNNLDCNTIIVSGGGGTGIASVLSNNDAQRESLNIFPNPASNVIRLGFTARNNGKVTARILDLTGREVMVQDFGTQYRGANDFRMDVSKLMPGLYTVELVQDNVRAVGRLSRQ